MLLIYSLKTTQRISYIFRHICNRVLGIDIKFTSVIEEFIAHSGPKLSYGKKPLGNELFLQSTGLLSQQGFEDFDISVKDWDDTKCFFSVGQASALPFDIFSASFYLLSRYEEYLPHVKDSKGRFSASESLAFKEKFLHEPIVDIWAYKFKKLLVEVFPQIIFPRKQMVIHTLINANQLFAFKNKGLLRSFSGFLKDMFKLKFRNFINRIAVISGFKKDPFDTFEWLINTAKKCTSKLTVFFLIGESVNFEEGTNSQRKTFKLLVKNVADYKQIGLVFSKDSLEELTILKTEKEQIETITNRALHSALNDEYIVSLPENYRNLIELEIKKDFTMVYEDIVGFRASSCTPFLFYDLDYEIVTPLLIHPISTTTQGLKKLKHKERQLVIDQLEASIKSVNGIFSIIFSNKDFNNEKDNEIWKTLFLKMMNRQKN